MLHGDVLVRDKVITTIPFVPKTRTDVHGSEILAVLERAASEPAFIAQLTRMGSEALRGYNLNWHEKAALMSGDINWIEEQVGPLDERLCTWLNCRLQQEQW